MRTRLLALLAAVCAAVLLFRVPAGGQQEPQPCTTTAGTIEFYFCDALRQNKQVVMDGGVVTLTAANSDHFVIRQRRMTTPASTFVVPYSVIREIEAYERRLVVRRYRQPSS